MVLVLRYLHYLHQKTPKQISDKIQQISDIFQQNISDIFQQTDISMIKSGNRHFGHIQAYFFGLIQHAHMGRRQQTQEEPVQKLKFHPDMGMLN